MNKEVSKKIISRLHRIEGQVRGVEKMIDTGKSFENIMIQISAIGSATSSIKKLLIQEKINNEYDLFLKTQDKKNLENIEIIIKKYVK